MPKKFFIPQHLIKVNLYRPESELTKELGCCAQTIRRLRKENGVVVRKGARKGSAYDQEVKKVKDWSASNKEIARKLGVTVGVVIYLRRRYGKHKPVARPRLYNPTPEQLKLPWAQFCKELGCSGSTAWKLRKAAGTIQNPKNP